jgi:hypothetical protein
MSWRDLGKGIFSDNISNNKLTQEADRYVTIIIRDAHDDAGPGMQFRLKYLATFKEAFDTFKAACCKTCRATGEIRFKTSTDVVAETDTPKKVEHL